MIEQKASDSERELETALAQSEELSSLLKTAADTAQGENL